MQDFKKNQQVQLADGKTYLYIDTILMNGHSYHFLSPKDEDTFIVGEILNEDGKRFFKIIRDKDLIIKIQDHYRSYPESLLSI